LLLVQIQTQQFKTLLLLITSRTVEILAVHLIHMNIVLPMMVMDQIRLIGMLAQLIGHWFLPIMLMVIFL